MTVDFSVCRLVCLLAGLIPVHLTFVCLGGGMRCLRVPIVHCSVNTYYWNLKIISYACQ